MKIKNRIIYLLIIFLYFFLVNNIVKAADFDAWVGAPAIFTIGKPEEVNIYVRNNGPTDSYNITYTKFARKNLQDVPHLVSVAKEYYTIKLLTTNETGDTFAMITLLGPIDSGNVTFNITSVDHTKEVSISLISGSPMVLSEFNLSGLIQILILAIFILIISYTSHFS